MAEISSQSGPYNLAYTFSPTLLNKGSSPSWRFILSRSQEQNPFLKFDVTTSQLVILGLVRRFASPSRHAAEGYLIEMHFKISTFYFDVNLITL